MRSWFSNRWNRAQPAIIALIVNPMIGAASRSIREKWEEIEAPKRRNAETPKRTEANLLRYWMI
jgi:hypothetical protein